jgi:hypothetical protein
MPKLAVLAILTTQIRAQKAILGSKGYSLAPPIGFQSVFG